MSRRPASSTGSRYGPAATAVALPVIAAARRPAAGEPVVTGA
jgi:hypothetical protein